MNKITQFNIIMTITSLIIMFTVGNCSKKSEKDIILDTMEEIGAKAEKRDLNGILYYISADYTDYKDRGKAEIQKQIEENFNRHKGIVASILATKIVVLNLPEAEIQTDVMFSSGAAKMLRKLINFAGNCYRFNLHLIKEGNFWKIKRASWDYISIEELLPDSIDILKNLTP